MKKVLSDKNMKKYHRNFKKYKAYKNQQKRNNILKNKTIKNTKTYFDKLYIRIFLSSLLLLLLLSGKNLLKLNIFNNLNNNMNILPVINLFTNIYDLNINDIPVNVINTYENIDYIKGINYISDESYNGVNVVSTGIVVKIEKKKELYFVTIKNEEGLEYTYGNLTNIDVSIYSYVPINTTIGTSTFSNNCYSFTLEITDNTFKYSLLDLNNE